MFTLSKSFRFEASHCLPHHQGKCARLHGHSWVGKVYCQGEQLQREGGEAGMLLDYARIKAVLKPLLEQHLDHWHLNESTGLENPTSEALARWIFEQLQPQLPWLVAVEIQETCTSSCFYQPGASPLSVGLFPAQHTGA